MDQPGKRYTWNYIGLLCFVLFLFSLVPILWITQYAHPSADDFSFGAITAETWATTHSVPDVIRAAWEQSMQRYQDWQGSFFAVFLMALQPAIFGAQFYGLGPLFLILVQVFSTAFFLKILLQSYMGMGLASYSITASLLLILTIQYFYAPAEGLYWFNGGIYYTFFYSLSLILFGCILKLLLEKAIYKRVVMSGICILLAIMIGGGNYTTALCVTILLVCLVVFLGWKREKVELITMCCILMAVFIPFFISILSPGNMIRQNAVGEPSAIKAILLSFLYGLYSLSNVLTVPAICIWIFLLPILFHFANKSSFSFSHPILVLSFSFCTYCAQATPPFYALGFSLPERIINIIYASSYLFLLIDLYYICGWISRKWPENPLHQYIMNRTKLHPWRYFVVMATIFMISCIGLCSISKGSDGMPAIQHLPVSIDASLSLLSGEAQQYDQEWDKREAAFLDKKGEDVLVSSLSVAPSILVYEDISEDPENWHNQVLASYYGLHSVAVQTTDEP